MGWKSCSEYVPRTHFLQRSVSLYFVLMDVLYFVMCTQTHPVRTCKRWESVDCELSLGSWLLSFLELYGSMFNYAELGISPHPEAHYFRKVSSVPWYPPQAVLSLDVLISNLLMHSM